MSWDDKTDLILRTTISAFKTTAIYTRAADPLNPISLNGVFNKPEVSVDPNTGVPVSSTAPSFGIRLADLPAQPAAGDAILIKAVSYRVIESSEDGQGGTTLRLEGI